MAAGVPASDILTEEISRTTGENLREAKRVMEEQGLRSAVIVSDAPHLKRAASMAADVGIDAVTSPTRPLRATVRSAQARVSWRGEVVFLHGYWLTGK